MEFEPLNDYEGLYEINRNGDIKTIKRQGTIGGLKKPTVCKKGYKYVSLCKNGKQKTHTLHTLLGIQFLENINNYPVIDHIDRNKLNNELSNLRWCSYSTNNENRKCTGCICKCIDKYKNTEYIYYRVCYRKIKKRFKTLTEAEKFLEELILTSP